ncbi:ATP-binding protein [Amycolatopsis sp. RTGN1]|uniref:ATP-binding protein n=1 Tax=Amycolatopsis ponsaeliensis TaxID=2992142 RepID=UPI00254D4E9C|nr:ATP-binding protein [Amycolatopsis sp. RTGN1]
MDFDEELARLTRKLAGAAEVRVALGGLPDLREVRSQVAESLTFGACPDDRFGGVLLVIDELVGNAYRHATAVRELHVARTGENLLVEVGDRDPDVTSVRAGHPGSGRYGLRLVGQLSLEWGVRAEGGGKVVWALVPMRIFPAAP